MRSNMVCHKPSAAAETTRKKSNRLNKSLKYLDTKTLTGGATGANNTNVQDMGYIRLLQIFLPTPGC